MTTIAIRALDVGFDAREAENNNGVRVTTEDADGDGLLELVARFNGPFPSHVAFRVDTKNADPLSMHVEAWRSTPTT